MSFSFVEIGDECTYNTFDITSEGTIIINGNTPLKIISAKNEESIVFIQTEKLFSNFGNYLEVELNYMYLELFIDSNSSSGDIMFGSKITYGYNKENSYVDVLSQALITKKLYEDIKERFDISYGDINILSPFLNHMYKYSNDFKNTSKILEDLCNISYPLKKMCKPLDYTTFENSYNWLILRNTDKEPSLLEEVLEAILHDKKQNVSVHYSKTKSELSSFKDIDIYVIINPDEEACYDVPSDSFCILCPDAFYQSSRRLLRNLPKVLDWANSKNIPDRKVIMKSDLPCGGCDKEGGCCQDNGDLTSCCQQKNNSSCEQQESSCKQDDISTYKVYQKSGCCGGGTCGGCK